MLTEPLIDWRDDWPLPSWLAKPADRHIWHHATLRLADGREYTGVLARARRHGVHVMLDWLDGAGPPALEWEQVTSLTMTTALLECQSSGPANPWDRQIPHKRLAFELAFAEGHAQAAFSGWTLGYLWAHHGLFLFVEQPCGEYVAQWFRARALDTVRIGNRTWTPGRQAAHEPLPAIAPAAAQAAPQHPAPATSISELVQASAAARALPVSGLRQVLLDLALCTPAGLEGMVHTPGLSVVEDMVRQDLLTHEQACHVLARMAGVAEADLAHFEYGTDAGALSPEDSSRYRVCALGSSGETFYAASANPTDSQLALLLSSLLKRHVELVWAAGAGIDARIERLLQSVHDPRAFADVNAAAFNWTAGPATAATRTDPAHAPAAKVHAPQPHGATPSAPPAADEHLAVLVKRAIVEASTDPMGEHPSEVIESSDFVKLVKRIIEDALEQGASDIHIETNPGQAVTRIRFRRDGDMEHYLSLPSALRAPLVSRIKVMARLDISERRRPQDGKINFADFGGAKLELRVAVLPTHDGLEDVVMRLLATSDPIPLAALGLQARDENAVMAMAGHSFGLILAVGPTGSGKTTTLHSILKELNTAKRKVWTAEDPIEITQDGLRQVQVNPKIGVTFASAMRAFLRADPDVIMIGEIRDEETSRIAIEASLTGHLVLSTLHTNSAAESVTRLLDMGMDPMTFGDSLIGIVAQRLVRGLCGRCAAAVPLPPEAFEALVQEYILDSPLEAAEGRARLLAAGGVDAPGDLTVKTAVGCPHCAGKGYKGRTGVYEVLQNSPALRALIQQKTGPHRIFDAAVKAGMRSLRHDALEKVLQGRIDMVQARAAFE